MKKYIKILFIMALIGFAMIGSNKQTNKIEAANNFQIDGSTLISYTGDESIVRVPNGVVTIGQGAFQENTSVSQVVLPQSVINIELRAFLGCSNLVEINLENVAKFGEMVFEGTSLDEVVLSDKVTELPLGLFAYTKVSKITLGKNTLTIGNSAFYQCSNLSEIELPESVYSIGSQTFFGCTNLSEIVLPSNLELIGSQCFTNSGIKEIVIPENVKEIPSACFSNCNQLTSITLNEGVEVLAYTCLQGTSIKELNLPSTVKEVAMFALAGMEKLEKVNVDENNQYLCSDNGILYTKNYEMLKCIPINYKSALVTLKDGLKITEEQCAVSLKNVRKIIIPEGMINIEHSTFMFCTNLEEVIIPSTVEIINSGAFYGCQMLYNITLPEGLKVLSSTEWFYGVFANCSSLTSVVIPDSVESIGSYLFNGCTSLQRVVFPAGVTDMGINLFSECSNLEEIVVKEGNKFAYSKDGVFYEITNGEGALSVYPAQKDGTTYTIPSDVSIIRASAFDSVAKLEEVIIPDTVVTIGDSVFANTSSLKKVTLPSNMTTLPDTMFFKSSIEEVILPSTLKTIGRYSFGFTHNLKNITFPEGLVTIGDSAFYESSIEEAILPNSVIEINNAFMHANELKKVVLSTSIQTLVASSFNNTKITEIRIPESMIDIPEYAFYNCQFLETVYIPKSVTTFSMLSFSQCPNLKDIVVDPANIFIKEIDGILYNEDYTSILYVNKTHVASKITIPDTVVEIPGQTFKDIVNIKELIIPKSIETYGRNAFYNAGFEVVTFVDGVEHIDDFLFRGCYNLREVNIPDSVKTIGTGLFEECSSLEEVTFPEGVDISIAFSMFRDCISLKSFTLPSDAKVIPQYMFSGCMSLTEIIIPDTVNRIECNAFEKCINIKELIIPSSVNTLEADICLDSGVTSIVFLGNAPTLKSSVFSSTHFDKDANIYIMPSSTGFTGSSYRAYTKQISRIQNNIFNNSIQIELTNNGDYTISVSVDDVYANLYEYYIKNTSGEYELLTTTTDNNIVYENTIGGNTYEFMVKSIINNNNNQFVSSSNSSIYIAKSDDDYQMDYLIAKINNINDYMTLTKTELATIVAQYNGLEEHLQTVVDENTVIEDMIVRYGALVDYDNDIAKIVEIEATASKTTINKGEEATITVTFPNEVINKDVTYKSSNTRVATVDQNGKVVAISSGKTIITVTALSGVTDTIEINVNEVVEPEASKKGCKKSMEHLMTLTTLLGLACFLFTKKRGHNHA